MENSWENSESNESPLGDPKALEYAKKENSIADLEHQLARAEELWDQARHSGGLADAETAHQHFLDIQAQLKAAKGESTATTKTVL